MSISVTLYTLTKKRNSTLRPTGGLPTVGELKEETSLINPTVTVAPIPGVGIHLFNYAYIPDFQRYYWIEECIWENGRYSFILSCDVLATYKAAIGASSQYILRAASEYDTYIVDSDYPTKSLVSLNGLLLGQNQRQNLENGYFIIGVIAPDSSILGCTTYYVLNWRAALALRIKMLSNLQWTGVTEITDELLQTLFNPYQYIVSYKWFPLSPPQDSLNSVTQLKLGYWTFDISDISGAAMYLYVAASIPTATIRRYSIEGASIPSHPQIARGRYLNGSGYSDYYLMMTGYGRQQLPNDAIVAGYGLTIYETVDYVSGDSILDVYMGANENETTTPVISVQSHIGVDLPYGSSDQNVLSAAGSVLNGVTGAIGSIMSMDFTGLISNVATGIVNAAGEIAPVIQAGGSSGSFAAIGQFTGNDSIECVFHLVADEDNSDIGRPLCKVRTVSTLSGYIMCLNSHCPISGTETEQAQVEQFLSGGFFYE